MAGFPLMPQVLLPGFAGTDTPMLAVQWTSVGPIQLRGARLRADTRIATCMHPADDVEHAQDREMILACLVPEAVEVAP